MIHEKYLKGKAGTTCTSACAAAAAALKAPAQCQHARQLEHRYHSKASTQLPALALLRPLRAKAEAAQWLATLR